MVAGDGYYTLRLTRRLGPGATIYAQDVERRHLDRLAARLAREGITGVTLVHGTPSDPRLPDGAVDVAILAHVYHEIENPRVHVPAGAAIRPDWRTPLEGVGIRFISAVELRALMVARTAMTLVDSRDEVHYQRGHLPGAICIPAEDLPLRFIDIRRPKRPSSRCVRGGGLRDSGGAQRRGGER